MRSSRNSLQASALHAVEADVDCSCGQTPHTSMCDVMTAAYSHSFRQAKIAERRRAAAGDNVSWAEVTTEDLRVDCARYKNKGALQEWRRRFGEDFAARRTFDRKCVGCGANVTQKEAHTEVFDGLVLVKCPDCGFTREPSQVRA